MNVTPTIKTAGKTWSAFIIRHMYANEEKKTFAYAKTNKAAAFTFYHKLINS